MRQNGLDHIRVGGIYDSPEIDQVVFASVPPVLDTKRCTSTFRQNNPNMSTR